MKNAVKNLLAIVGLTAASFTTQAAIGTIGGPIFNPANGHNYFIVGEGTWTQTEAYALTLGGHLVTINDSAENAWLTANILLANPTFNPWMGLNDADANGTWEWVSGEPVNYLNWAPGEPNFPQERHGNLYPGNHAWAGQWNNAPDVIESGVLYGIVEVPEPSTFALGLISCACLTVVRHRRNA
jgi:hypothetical protein